MAEYAFEPQEIVVQPANKMYVGKHNAYAVCKEQWEAMVETAKWFGVTTAELEVEKDALNADLTAARERIAELEAELKRMKDRTLNAIWEVRRRCDFHINRYKEKLAALESRPTPDWARVVVGELLQASVHSNPTIIGQHILNALAAVPEDVRREAGI